MTIDTTKENYPQLDEPHKMTNREWLESLPDEEFVMNLCESCKTCNTDCSYITTCNHGLLIWLKAEHKEVS